ALESVGGRGISLGRDGRRHWSAPLRSGFSGKTIPESSQEWFIPENPQWGDVAETRGSAAMWISRDETDLSRL
ncbi:MAG: hypothetical protein KJO13_07830, partial [Gammaproteobacteria bacterium]|nr:hypothetical protein [Gammaproteobacteria bacterium]